MFILTTAMEDSSFGLNGIKCVVVPFDLLKLIRVRLTYLGPRRRYFNICVQYYYVALLRAFPSRSSLRPGVASKRTDTGPDPTDLFPPSSAVCCFILALGNRPQGAKGFYIVIAISFALIMVYMLVRRPLSSRPLTSRARPERDSASRA